MLPSTHPLSALAAEYTAMKANHPLIAVTLAPYFDLFTTSPLMTIPTIPSTPKPNVY